MAGMQSVQGGKRKGEKEENLKGTLDRQTDIPYHDGSRGRKASNGADMLYKRWSKVQER